MVITTYKIELMAIFLLAI